MCSYRRIALILFLIFSVASNDLTWSKELRDSYSYQPITNEGKKWRIAYYQGGLSNNYYPYLVATIKGLISLGWIEKLEIPMIEGQDPLVFWVWLSKNVKSKYVEFVADAYYTANWDSNTRASMKKTIIDRLNTKKDIDLVIAMGTWAGIDLANNQHSTPIMVMSSSDPVGAGIINSNQDSGYDHVFARVDPERWDRQVRIFHKIINFKRLGIAYEDTVAGRSYAAIDFIEKIGKEQGFDIVRCFTKNDIPDLDEAGASVLKCFDELVPQVDAIYIVIQNGVNDKTLPKLISIANKHRIPTFSQQGSDEVSKGVLMSISREGGFVPVGRFLAISMAKIFNGAKPRQLNQVFEEGPTIAINLKTAEMIGLYLSAEVLAAADEMYREIVNP